MFIPRQSGLISGYIELDTALSNGKELCKQIFAKFADEISKDKSFEAARILFLDVLRALAVNSKYLEYGSVQ